MAVELTDEQVYTLYDIENWWSSLNHQTYELSAPAGAGKTFLIRYFIDRIGLPLDKVAFIAFQGKASMQMARNGLPAQTIHSLIYRYEKVVCKDEYGKIEVTPSGKIKTKMQFILRDKLPKDVELIVVDEAGMVSEEIALDILSFKIPVIALGDLNQLPPVFGKSYFLKKPHAVLTKIMRQSENNPIIWLSQQVLQGKPLKTGVYGKSMVLPKSELNEFTLKQADMVLTSTNKLRGEINTLFRENILNLKKLELPNIGEKIICRRNDWNRSINDFIYLTNGISGTIDYVDIESYDGKSIKIDFQPDFINKKFKNLVIDYDRLFSTPGDNKPYDSFEFTRELFEFAYAITVHLSQGSQYDNVVFLLEKMGWDKDFNKRLQYTAITRAIKSIIIYI